MPPPALVLAPMEGVLDPLVRALLTSVNEYDLCITEFLRVTDTLLPAKTFYRICPELKNQGKTASGTPVRIQLLGQSPEYLAQNAVRAIELGSHGIDLNCGCPSRFVNGHGGGASLLKSPETLYLAVKEIVDAMPKGHLKACVSVKIRLGWSSSNEVFEIADAVIKAGANELAIHGRTKEDGYKADRINWQAINMIKQKSPIKVIANGEIWDFESAQHCQTITGCDALMIGRGALTLPNIASVIKGNSSPMDWQAVLALLLRYFEMENQNKHNTVYHMGRTKQWLNYLRVRYPQAEEMFRLVRPLKKSDEVHKVIQHHYALSQK